MSKIKKSEEISIEREKEIQQVVESVSELAQIMKDLSALVIDQVQHCNCCLASEPLILEIL
jgi:syntaxin 16